MTSAAKVADIFKTAGSAFSKLGDMTMELHKDETKSPGTTSKWTDEEVDLLKEAVLRFGQDIEKISQMVKNRTFKQIKDAIKRKLSNDTTTNVTASTTISTTVAPVAQQTELTNTSTKIVESTTTNQLVNSEIKSPCKSETTEHADLEPVSLTNSNEISEEVSKPVIKDAAKDEHENEIQASKKFKTTHNGFSSNSTTIETDEIDVVNDSTSLVVVATAEAVEVETLVNTEETSKKEQSITNELEVAENGNSNEKISTNSNEEELEVEKKSVDNETIETETKMINEDAIKDF